MKYNPTLLLLPISLCLSGCGSIASHVAESRQAMVEALSLQEGQKKSARYVRNGFYSQAQASVTGATVDEKGNLQVEAFEYNGNYFGVTIFISTETEVGE